MKDKIINVIHKKLCDSLRTEFLPRKKFEQEFAKHSPELIQSITSLVESYHQLVSLPGTTGKGEIINVSKDAYLVDQLNHYTKRFSNNYSVEDLSRLKDTNPYKALAIKYDDYLAKSRKEVVFSLIGYIKHKTQGLTELEESETNFSIQYLFWRFFHQYYADSKEQTKEIVKHPELVLKKFNEYYSLNNQTRSAYNREYPDHYRALNLLELAEKNINDESFKGYEQFIVNVGKIESTGSGAGWVNSRFSVYNNKCHFYFSNSVRDGKIIDGPFIHIFIVQQKYLIKISITETEVERTQFIIQRDCEKVSLKNDCELVITKHHGNETIILDSRKEALTLQQKFIEIREGQHKR